MYVKSGVCACVCVTKTSTAAASATGPHTAPRKGRKGQKSGVVSGLLMIKKGRLAIRCWTLDYYVLGLVIQ